MIPSYLRKFKNMSLYPILWKMSGWLRSSFSSQRGEEKSFREPLKKTRQSRNKEFSGVKSIEIFSSIFHKHLSLIVFKDIFFIIISLQISLFLRLGDDISQVSLSTIVINTALYILFGISIFLGKHIYKGKGYYTSLGEPASTSLAVTYITLLYIPVMLVLPQDLSLPRSTPFINWFVLIVLLGIPRLFDRLTQNKSLEVEPENSASSLKPQIQSLIPEDLLKRSHVSFDPKRIEAIIKGKKILVTGAGGTIGGELVRQISKYKPSRICLLDHSEYLLCIADVEMSESHPKLSRDNVLADVACRERIRNVISTFKPELVFHAAALKQISLGEENPSQAVLANVIGTRNVAEACRDFNVKTMLLISTNEALNPLNTIGATKRLAECYCQALDNLEQKKANGTRYISVRFGNVLESLGSIVPLFRRQIERGGPIKLTHPDMTRYFITLQEVGELILQAMLLAGKPETPAGRIFVLNRGEPLKILDLVKQMLNRAGLKPDVDIKINFTGLKAGEKLIEDLSAEHLSPTSNPHISMGNPRTLDHGFLTRAFHELETIAKDQDQDSLFRLLHALVPDYKKSVLTQEDDEVT